MSFPKLQTLLKSFIKLSKTNFGLPSVLYFQEFYASLFSVLNAAKISKKIGNKQL